MKQQMKSLDVVRDQINAAISICINQNETGILIEDPKVYMEDDAMKDIYQRMEKYAQSENHDPEHWVYFPTHIDTKYYVHFAAYPIHPDAKPEPGTDFAERFFLKPIALIRFI